MNNSQLWLTIGFSTPLLVGQKGTTWTFEPRGDAYMSVFMSCLLCHLLKCQDRIGNAVNAMALQLEPNAPSVSQLMFEHLGSYI